MKKTTLFIAILMLAVFYNVQAVEHQTAACTASSMNSNLEIVASGYLTTVTHLTVTGTINGRDFVTMRDKMPLLDTIDLSSAEIVSYVGVNGPNNGISTSYPGNEIPTFSFYDKSKSIGKVSLKSFIYPQSITKIGDKAFNQCTGLTGSLDLPSSLITIGNYAFYMCSGLTGSINIPASVTTIGIQAFARCGGLFVVNNANSNFTSIDGVLFDKNISTLLVYPYYKSVSYTIPSSVTTVGDWAFYYCSGLGSLSLPSSITTISNSAFNYCSGLESITIPSSVSTIGYSAFGNCKNLTLINSLASTPIFLQNFTFDGTDISSTCILHVPVDSKASYLAAPEWQEFGTIIEDIVPTSVEKLSSVSVSIFPNPAISYITISELSSLVNSSTVTISVSDITGNALLVKVVEPTINTLTLDISTLKNGIYFINIQSSNANIAKRFVKQ